MSLQASIARAPDETSVEAELQLDDAELVRRALLRQGWAERELYERHASMVAAIAVRLLRDPAEAQDVVQDAFLVAFSVLDTLDAPGAFAGWLRRIALTQVSRRVRRGSWRRFLRLDDPFAKLEQLAAPGASPSVRAELSRIDRALGRLGATERIAWVLRHVEGYMLEEVADACGCSLATAKRRLASAEGSMRAHVGERHER